MPVVKPPLPVLQSNQYATGLAYFAVCYEGSGTTLNDLSASANNGTVLSTEWGTGQFSGADLDIGNNVSNVCTLPAITGFNQAGDFSISVWVKLPSFAFEVLIGCYGEDSSATNVYGWVVYENGSGGIVFHTANGGDPSGEGFASTGTLTTATWHHIACTIDVATQTKRIYLDGTLDSTSASGQQFPAYFTSGSHANKAVVGGYWDGSSIAGPLVGEIDAPAIYSYVLPASGGSDDSVAGIFADPFRAVRPPNTVAIAAAAQDAGIAVAVANTPPANTLTIGAAAQAAAVALTLDEVPPASTVLIAAAAQPSIVSILAANGLLGNAVVVVAVAQPAGVTIAVEEVGGILAYPDPWLSSAAAPPPEPDPWLSGI